MSLNSLESLLLQLSIIPIIGEHRARIIITFVLIIPLICSSSTIAIPRLIIERVLGVGLLLFGSETHVILINSIDRGLSLIMWVLLWALCPVLILAELDGLPELVVLGNRPDAAWLILTGLLAFTCSLRTFVLVLKVCFLDLELFYHLTRFKGQILALLEFIVIFFNNHTLYILRVFPLIARMLRIRGEAICSLPMTLDGVLLGVQYVGMLLILLDVLRGIANLVETRPVGLTLVLVSFRLVLRTKVLVNALHRRSIHVSIVVWAARLVIIISIRSYFVHDLFGIKLWDVHITTVTARIIPDNLLMICDLGKIEGRLTILTIIITLDLIFPNFLPFGIHGRLHFLLLDSVLIIAKVFVCVDLALIIEVAHRLQKLFLLLDLWDSARALALGINIVIFVVRNSLACGVFSNVLTVDSWHRCLSIICNIFILLSRLLGHINGIVSPVSIVSVLLILRLIHLADLSRECLCHIAKLTYLANIDVRSLTHFRHAVA